MSFWESDVGSALLATKSALETLLDKPETRLEDVLDQDDLLQQCSNKNANLVEYLARPSIVRRMIEYITHSVEENVGKYSEEHGIELDVNDIEPPSFGVTIEQLELEQKSSQDSTDLSSLSASSASSASSIEAIDEKQSPGDADVATDPDLESRSQNVASETPSDEQVGAEENSATTEPETAPISNGHVESAENGGAENAKTEEETKASEEETRRRETKELLEKIRVKYPYLCSEILASQLGPVLECIMADEHGFLDLLFEHIRRDPPLDAVLTNYWRTAVVALTRRESSKIISYFRANNDILDRLIQHISDQSIMELVITLGWDPFIEELQANLDEIADWMKEQDLIPKLIQMMQPQYTPNDHSAASYTLVDIVAKSQRCTNLTLFDHLSSSEQVRNLMTGIFVDDQSSMLESLSVLIALLHHYPNLRAEKQVALERERLGVGNKPKAGDDSSSESDEGDKSAKEEDVIPPVIVVVMERIEDFKRLLLTPPTTAMQLSVGLLDPPLGPVRLKVVDLLVAVMRTPYPPMAEAFRDRNIVGLCLSLFFEFPWNNLLHGSVEHIIQMTLSGMSNILKESLFEDHRFLLRILEARDLSLKHQSETGLRLGFTGHLTRISNTVVEFAKRDEYLEKMIKGQAEWQAFMAEGLREENDKLNVQLGGHRPAQLEDDDIMFHIDLGDKESTGKILEDLEMNLKQEDEYRMPGDEDLSFGSEHNKVTDGDWHGFGSWPFDDVADMGPRSPGGTPLTKQRVIPDDEGPHSSDEDEDEEKQQGEDQNAEETTNTDGKPVEASNPDGFDSFLSRDADLFFSDAQAGAIESSPSDSAPSEPIQAKVVENAAVKPSTSDPFGDDWGDPFAAFDGFDGANSAVPPTEQKPDES